MNPIKRWRDRQFARRVARARLEDIRSMRPERSNMDRLPEVSDPRQP